MEQCDSDLCTSVRDIPDVPHGVFAYHVGLLNDAGLIKAVDASSMDGIDWIPLSITHEGHEFLDGVRSETTWKSAKEKVASTATSLSLEALKAAVGVVVRHAITGA